MKMLLGSLLALAIVTPAHAQLAPPNEAGITFGHVHLTVQDIDLGEDGPADFLIEPVDSLFPARHGLPNGAMHLLVATAITRSELTFATAEGHQALLAKLFEDGQGQVSVLGRDPVA